MQCGDQQQLQTQQLQVSRGSRKCETVIFFFPVGAFEMDML